MSELSDAVTRARMAPSDETVRQAWHAAFALGEWHFIGVVTASGDVFPFAQRTAAGYEVLAFSEARLARGYAVAIRMARDEASARVISRPADTVCDYLVPYVGYGVTHLVLDTRLLSLGASLQDLATQQFMYRIQTIEQRLPAGPVRVSRDELLRRLDAASRDPSQIESALSALVAEPSWYLITTREDVSFPAIEMWGSAGMAVQVYSDEQTAMSMAALMSMGSGSFPPMMFQPPSEIVSRLAELPFIEVVAFNPRGEQLVVPFERVKNALPASAKAPTPAPAQSGCPSCGAELVGSRCSRYQCDNY